MKAIFLFVLLILNIAAFERKSKSSTKETTDEEASLITEIIAWRQGFNLNKGGNQLDRIEELDLSSLFLLILSPKGDKESEYLLQNPDKFGVQDNFNSNSKLQILSDDQYFTEVIVKIQDANKSNPVQQIIGLWTNDLEISEHLKYEYNQVGCSCKLYGNGRICVMHLRQI